MKHLLRTHYCECECAHYSILLSSQRHLSEMMHTTAQSTHSVKSDKSYNSRIYKKVPDMSKISIFISFLKTFT